MPSTGCFSWLTRRLWKKTIVDCADHLEVQTSTEKLPEVERVIVPDVAEETRGAVMISSGVSGPFVF